MKNKQKYKRFDSSQFWVDDLVLVSDDLEHWRTRYFDKYKDGKIYVWKDGLTSWTEHGSECWRFMCPCRSIYHAEEVLGTKHDLLIIDEVEDEK